MNRNKMLSFTVILLFFGINLFTLMDFPVVHSDEIWLKGIANHMMTIGRFDVTEPFYDLYPRVVHPLRWLYNGTLIIALHMFGNSIFTMRLVSLICMTFVLRFMIPIINKRFGENGIAPLTLAALALNILLIVSSHTGRQEALILLIMVYGYRLFILAHEHLPIKLSLLLTLAFGVHPNSFLIGVVFSALFFFGVVMKRIPFRHLLQFMGLAAVGLTLTVLAGLVMNPDFISGYLAYGESLGVDAEPLGRFAGFYWYFIKLFNQIGGTYDLFQIKGLLIALFILLPSYLLFWLIYRFYHKRTQLYEIFLPAVTAFALMVGLLFIGRYNQTAVVFFVPFVYLMLLETIHALVNAKTFNIKKTPLTVTIALVLAMSIISGVNLNNNLIHYWKQRFYDVHYESMLQTLKSVVSDDAIVLGNLNTLEAFDPYRFFDVRNLGYLRENGIDFETYVRERQIDTLVIHEEMEYLYRTSPKWDFLYVNLDYYEDMQRFIKDHCMLVKSFENPIYAMRISRFTGTYPWKTSIYKVLP